MFQGGIFNDLIRNFFSEFFVRKFKISNFWISGSIQNFWYIWFKFYFGPKSNCISRSIIFGSDIRNEYRTVLELLSQLYSLSFSTLIILLMKIEGFEALSLVCLSPNSHSQTSTLLGRIAFWYFTNILLYYLLPFFWHIV